MIVYHRWLLWFYDERFEKPAEWILHDLDCEMTSDWHEIQKKNKNKMVTVMKMKSGFERTDDRSQRTGGWQVTGGASEIVQRRMRKKVALDNEAAVTHLSRGRPEEQVNRRSKAQGKCFDRARSGLADSSGLIVKKGRGCEQSEKRGKSFLRVNAWSCGLNATYEEEEEEEEKVGFGFSLLKSTENCYN